MERGGAFRRVRCACGHLTSFEANVALNLAAGHKPVAAMGDPAAAAFGAGVEAIRRVAQAGAVTEIAAHGRPLFEPDPGIAKGRDSGNRSHMIVALKSEAA